MFYDYRPVIPKAFDKNVTSLCQIPSGVVQAFDKKAMRCMDDNVPFYFEAWLNRVGYIYINRRGWRYVELILPRLESIYFIHRMVGCWRALRCDSGEVICPDRYAARTRRMKDIWRDYVLRS